MSRPNQPYKITEDTEFVVEEGWLTENESDWLRSNSLAGIKGYNTDSGEVTEIRIDIKRLAQMAFEFDLLQSVASTVETDILKAFRTAEKNILTTSEISDRTGRPASSVSRALSRLVEKGKLGKVQAGVYEYRG